ncbi:MAG: hypothetical protein M9920_05595 [Verrucomicrobiae bacterium]|nr:hypothetical protein [Verrucomicrobiae bacterium]
MDQFRPEMLIFTILIHFSKWGVWQMPIIAELGLLVAFLAGHQLLKPAKIPPSPTTQSQAKIGLVPINTRRAADYSTEEMIAFAERFEKAFKPAI